MELLGLRDDGLRWMRLAAAAWLDFTPISAARRWRGTIPISPRSIDQPEDFDTANDQVCSPKIAKALIAAGADVNVRDNAGDTALKIATRRGYADMAEALKAAGAKEMQ